MEGFFDGGVFVGAEALLLQHAQGHVDIYDPAEAAVCADLPLVAEVVDVRLHQIAAAADIKQVLGRGAEDGVVFRPDEAQDDGYQLDGLGSIEQLPDHTGFISARQKPEIELDPLQGGRDAAFKGKHPEALESPVPEHLEIVQVVIGKLCVPPQAANLAFDGLEIKYRAVFLPADLRVFVQAGVVVSRFCTACGHRSHRVG